jgi:hypothetical protein
MKKHGRNNTWPSILRVVGEYYGINHMLLSLLDTSIYFYFIFLPPRQTLFVQLSCHPSIRSIIDSDLRLFFDRDTFSLREYMVDNLPADARIVAREDVEDQEQK